ncbi:DUF2336 domain-containing protein [Rhodopseudomonas sp. B29]|uniref:DUF2336 domain-containing protein n=1 Tax=Rhodopseudomonas sp. B29 TaxID=95607 RepID=UPI00034A090C|nr:DUF2336 domain-containing protein [Rhodopseudomonas sp. B29]
MTAPTMFPGFDGLMSLSRREGVDIRPTLLRVLTDLYVQTGVHTETEERQFVELTSRLIDEVDDATRAVVRARLSIYPHTPHPIALRLGLQQDIVPEFTDAPSIVPPSAPVSNVPTRPRTEAEQRIAALAMQPDDASQLADMFFAADTRERALILGNLAEAPLRPATRIHSSRAQRAIEALHMAAYVGDRENFTLELGNALLLSTRLAEHVVGDPGGEPLACALKALGMGGAAFEQVLMFLDPQRGTLVDWVYRLSRLYDRLSERAALIMLAAWRGATVAQTRAKYRAALYDDERHRARSSAAHAWPVHPLSPAARANRNSNG